MNNHVMVSRWSGLRWLIPAFSVAVVVFILWVYVNRQINLVNSRITADEETVGEFRELSQHGACAVYTLFIHSYSGQARDLYPAGQAAYDTDMRAIVVAAHQANCGLSAPPGLFSASGE